MAQLVIHDGAMVVHDEAIILRLVSDSAMIIDPNVVYAFFFL